MNSFSVLIVSSLISLNVCANGPSCREMFKYLQTAATVHASLKTNSIRQAVYHADGGTIPLHAATAEEEQKYQIENLYRQALSSTKGLKNPFSSDSQNSNTIGKAHLVFSTELRVYKEIYERKHSQNKVSVNDFDRLYKELEKETHKLTLPQTSVEKRFALLEALRLLQILDSRVDRPVPETTQDEAQKNEKEEDKKKDKNADQDDSVEEQEEEDFEWNQAPEKYAPENKDLGSSDGKSKKPVIVLRSEALTKTRLYGRTYYDVINDQGFYPAQLSRTIVRKDFMSQNANKKAVHIKNTKNKNIIKTIPIPEGYYAISGNYSGFKVVETAPQVYDIEYTQDPKTLGDELSFWITPIMAFDTTPTQAMSTYTNPTGLNQKLWPKKIQDAIADIRHKGIQNNLEIAKIIKDHLSGEEYLYFSKGDKVDDAKFAQLKAKYKQLLAQYPKPIAMAHLESFNCDGAAWIGAAILRDFFKIPTRVVGGSTAESGVQQIGPHTYEVITSSSPGHAWTEVWDDHSQRWVSFDMTPTQNTPNGQSQSNLDLKSREEQDKEKEKDNKDNNSSQKQDSKSQEDQNKESQSSKDQKGDSSSNSNSNSSSSDSKGTGAGDSKETPSNTVSDEKKRQSPDTHNSNSTSKDDGKDHKESKHDSADDKNSKDNNNKSDASDVNDGIDSKKDNDTKDGKEGRSEPHSDSQATTKQDDQIRTVERSFDPRQLKTRSHANTKTSLRDNLIDVFYSYYLKEGVDNGLSSSFKTQFDIQLTRFLNSFKFMHQNLKNENQALYLKKMDLQASLSDDANKDLISRFRSMNSNNTSGKLRNTWLELNAIKQHFDELKQTRELTLKESAFYTQLLTVLREFQNVKHKDSESFDLAERFNKALPGSISKKILNTRYPNFKELGSLDSQSLSQNILANKETDLIRLAMASPYTDLFLNSESVPQFQNIKTFDRSFNPNNPRDVIRTRRISDFPRMILQPKPGEHLLSDTIRGEQFALGYTETRRVPNPKQSVEKKVSVVYYDVSGSMAGSRMETQDALIMSFVDRALSEVDTLGRTTHKVYIIPFDDGIGQPLEISTREEAEQLINLQRISRKGGGRGGTEIQPVLMDFYDKVALAYKLDKEKANKSLANLKKANLVLFSDGGSIVDANAVKKRQDEIAKMTGIDMHLSFVSIEEENVELKRIAQNISTKTTKSSYYFINSREINNILNGSDFKIKNPEAFAFDPNEAVPRRLLEEFNKLKEMAAPESMLFDFQEFERILQGISVKNAVAGEEPVELKANVLDLKDTMNYVINDNEAPLNLKLLIAETALKKYLTGLGRSVHELTEVEYKILTQLVRMKKVN